MKEIKCLRCGKKLLDHEGGMALAEDRENLLRMKRHYEQRHPEVTSAHQMASELAAVTAARDAMEATMLAIGDALKNAKPDWVPLPLEDTLKRALENRVKDEVTIDLDFEKL